MCVNGKVLTIFLTFFLAGPSRLANGGAPAGTIADAASNVPQAEPDPAASDSEDQSEGESSEQDDNVFASVELAATNAGLAVKLMKKAIAVLLECSANAMESTESILRSGMQSVDSITTGASNAASQIGITPETVTDTIAALSSPITKPPKPQHHKKPDRQLKKRGGSPWWFW